MLGKEVLHSEPNSGRRAALHHGVGVIQRHPFSTLKKMRFGYI